MKTENFTLVYVQSAYCLLCDITTSELGIAYESLVQAFPSLALRILTLSDIQNDPTARATEVARPMGWKSVLNIVQRISEAANLKGVVLTENEVVEACSAYMNYTETELMSYMQNVDAELHEHHQFLEDVDVRTTPALLLLSDSSGWILSHGTIVRADEIVSHVKEVMERSSAGSR